MSTYTNLKIELLNVGDTGWGPTTNNNFQYALEEAMISSADVAFSSADVTLTLTNSNLSQTARNLRLVCTGTTGGTARNLILGSGCQFEKPFIVYNSCADAITVKNTSNTGISVPALRTMLLYNNGVDVVDAINYVSTLTIGDLSGAVVGTSATQTLTNKTISYASNTLTGVVGLTATQTLTGKTITFTDNTLTGVASTSTAQTLTNKTITYADNTLTGVAGTTATQTLTNKTLTNPTVTDYVETVNVLGILGATSALVLTSGTVLTATLGASCTFGMPTATAGKSFVLLLKQGAAGGYTATFTNVKFNALGAPTITTTAGAMDILTFVSDGTNWYGSYSQGYTP
jgi:hypothetical protein